MNYEAYSSFERESSDLGIVFVRICLGLHRNKKQAVNLYDISGPHLLVVIYTIIIWYL